MSIRTAVVPALVCLALASCGGGGGGGSEGPQSSAPQPTSSATIGPAGGTIKASGTAVVVFPAGAFSTSTVASVARVSAGTLTAGFQGEEKPLGLVNVLGYEARVTSGQVRSSTDVHVRVYVPQQMTSLVNASTAIVAGVRIRT